MLLHQSVHLESQDVTGSHVTNVWIRLQTGPNQRWLSASSELEALTLGLWEFGNCSGQQMTTTGLPDRHWLTADAPTRQVSSCIP